MQVDSEGMRRLNDKVVEQDEDINPVKKRNDAIKYIFSKMRTMNRNTKIYCKSFEQRKLYID